MSALTSDASICSLAWSRSYTRRTASKSNERSSSEPRGRKRCPLSKQEMRGSTTCVVHWRLCFSHCVSITTSGSISTSGIRAGIAFPEALSESLGAAEDPTDDAYEGRVVAFLLAEAQDHTHTVLREEVHVWTQTENKS